MTNSRIREGRESDFDAILELQRQWEAEDITIGFGAMDKKCLSKYLSRYIFVADGGITDGSGAQVLDGFALGTIRTADKMAIFADGELYIEIDDIYVAVGARGRGTGEALVSAMLDKAEKNGVHRSLMYSSNRDADKIFHFYGKQGFKPWYVQMYR